MIRVILFEDSPDFVEAMQTLLQDQPNMELIATFHTGKDAARHYGFYKPDLVVMDIDMPEENGLLALRAIRSKYTDATVIMLTVFEDDDRIFQAICAGAAGYLLKTSSPEKIIQSIEEAIEGGAPMTPSIARQVLKIFATPFQRVNQLEELTPREQDVLNYLVKGYSYKLIASDLQISQETVRFHIKNIYAKLHVNSKSEAVAKAMQQYTHKSRL